MKPTTRETGQGAESIAAETLSRAGYRIIETNYRSSFGEIDIIARDRAILVFVEVKYRSSYGFGGAAAAVTRRKQARVARTAACYIKQRRPECDGFRFDVVLLDPAGPEIVQNAFSSPLAFTL